MIQIEGQPGDKNAQLILTPRRGHKAGNAERSLPLLYGHTCQFCGNVLQAMFASPQAIDLFPYEETNIMTSSQKAERQGEVIKVLPGDDPNDSCYRSLHFPAQGGQQLIQLRRHLLRFYAFRGERTATAGGGDTKLDVGETGPVPCKYVGIFSRREDLLFYDLGLLFGMKPQELAQNYNLPSSLSALKDNSVFRKLKAVGSASPIVLMEWYTVDRGYNYWYREVLKPFLKPQQK